MPFKIKRQSTTHVTGEDETEDDFTEEHERVDHVTTGDHVTEEDVKIISQEKMIREMECFGYPC